MIHDVIVIGGGPAGSYLSRLLADAGCDVHLVEEHADAGRPVHCTGILADEAYDEFDLPRDTVLNTLSAVRFHAPGGGTVHYNGGRFSARVIDRARFDRRLIEQAAHHGVRVTFGRRVTSVERTDRGVRLIDETGARLEARVGVLACGASYGLHRQLRMGIPRMYLQSAQLEVAVDHHHDVDVFVGRQIAPSGFGWIVPVERPTGRFARIGVMCREDAGQWFQRLVDRAAPRWGVRARSEGRALVPRQKLLPLAPIPRTYTDRGLAVGDAAGLVKATTGGGIYYSLVSAALAAEVLIPALAQDTLSAGSLAPYEQAWHSRLGLELRAQQTLRQAAARLSDADVNRIFGLLRRDSVMALIRRTARFNEHRDVITTLLSETPLRYLLGSFDELAAEADLPV